MGAGHLDGGRAGVKPCWAPTSAPGAALPCQKDPMPDCRRGTPLRQAVLHAAVLWRRLGHCRPEANLASACASLHRAPSCKKLKNQTVPTTHAPTPAFTPCHPACSPRARPRCSPGITPRTWTRRCGRSCCRWVAAVGDVGCACRRVQAQAKEGARAGCQGLWPHVCLRRSCASVCVCVHA